MVGLTARKAYFSYNCAQNTYLTLFSSSDSEKKGIGILSFTFCLFFKTLFIDLLPAVLLLLAGPTFGLPPLAKMSSVCSSRSATRASYSSGTGTFLSLQIRAFFDIFLRFKQRQPRIMLMTSVSPDVRTILESVLAASVGGSAAGRSALEMASSYLVCLRTERSMFSLAFNLKVE